MKKYEVTGMSCAACQARVEKAVSGVAGVESCSVSLLTNSMGVEGTASDDEIIKAVEAAGYSKATKALLNGRKLKRLGWKPYHTIQDGIPRTIEILKTMA